jgi:hypothetical protein
MKEELFGMETTIEDLEKEIEQRKKYWDDKKSNQPLI